MFNCDDDLKAYEDELYHEETSSDESIDSELEFHLYSQLHYSQNLSESNLEEEEDAGGDSVGCLSGAQQQTNVCTVKDGKEVDLIILSDSDASPVIILSDTAEEESVYRSKVKKKSSSTYVQEENSHCGPYSHSTPKVSTPQSNNFKNKRSCQHSSRKSYSGGYVQEVLVIRGSSEDEEAKKSEEDLSVSESDMSDVENWMLLGRAKEDGDASIQLNLKGYKNLPNDEGERGAEWSISEKDSEAHIGNYTPLRRSNRYYTDKDVVCRNCDKRGHLSKNCPVPKKLPACCLCGERGHLQNSCPARYCLNCFLPGHFFKECIERAYWRKTCHRCSMTGHYADACPEIWRQYHLTNKAGPIKKPKSYTGQKDIVYCCNCAKKGHCNYECEERRMHSDNFPTCQLVFTYDREHDIWKRNERAKSKIKDLQEAGLLTWEIGEYNESKEDAKPPAKRRKKKRPSKKKKQGTLMDEECAETKQTKKRKKKRSGLQETEEDFPRGRPNDYLKYKKSSKKHDGSNLFKEDKKNLLKKGWRKKHKGKKGDSCAVDQDLLIIKQKKKNSKKRVD
ncbi:hypothetical protein XENTR_v10001509 [Xenopus tropicalis]|nr:zinc finger CCHC domain-containing protein 7 [Xenopus tropicalis]XP_031762546.1 zinc finger CCHC domain-containing protein 7 [Xenopus tropicalis]KAE8632304.1 hypothetical protein XENTR_v10001509 [Xenopus tropicalis]KAE8632305.1 hypothetical protein XENTR_v10001509 [Xenopus tropicalis]|eukprot:XP_002935926.2 PREDICTED: zinc finger CCHC domain-containing protein 7 [Xenopus tropicalis]